jgi:hypothetical protein
MCISTESCACECNHLFVRGHGRSVHDFTRIGKYYSIDFPRAILNTKQALADKKRDNKYIDLKIIRGLKNISTTRIAYLPFYFNGKIK